MLIIDDNMFKLAKMQETLLKVSTSNREENLEKYKKTVIEIDAKAFEDVLEETRHIDEHNHSLEEELQFLEELKKAYDQLLELQLSFKRNCELYGHTELKLSDLSRLNIEYIDNRISAISGYLINLKNIETNKKKLEELSDQLVDEEKKKLTLDNRLFELDKQLINNFLTSEGRIIEDGNLQYTSVVTEYEKIDLDLEELLDDNELLNKLVFNSEKEKEEISEKVRVAEVCYNNILTVDSKQIFEEINLELFKINYRVSMLKIIEFLSRHSDSYDMFIKKRENILDLIKYRLLCMEKLGMKNSIDPFGRTKITEQLNEVMLLTDNSKNISRIRKEISKLSSWTDEMLSQNSNYLITLGDTRRLIEDNMSINDVDISSVISFDDILVKQEILDNQVISVRTVSSKLNMNIVSQKTSSVIKRVNQMMNNNDDGKKEIVEEIVPELVIIPGEVVGLEENKTIDVIQASELILDKKTDELVVPKIEEETIVDEIKEEREDLKIESSGLDIFQTVTPFDEPSLFSDRIDDIEPKVDETNVTVSVDEPLLVMEEEIEEIIDDEKLKSIDQNVEEVQLFDELNSEIIDISDEMPDAFWVTQDDEVPVEEENVVSFDDQINALLATENNEVNKTRKKI